MRKGLALLHIDRKGCYLTIDDVPAWIFSQCDEPYFEEAEVTAVQEPIAVIDQKSQLLVARARTERRGEPWLRNQP